jgi:hypothetical protein
VGIGRPQIKSSAIAYLSLTAKSKITVDNILFDGQSFANSGMVISGSQNITLHATDFFQYTGIGPVISNSTHILLDSTNFYANTVGL